MFYRDTCTNVEKKSCLALFFNHSREFVFGVFLKKEFFNLASIYSPEACTSSHYWILTLFFFFEWFISKIFHLFISHQGGKHLFFPLVRPVVVMLQVFPLGFLLDNYGCKQSCGFFLFKWNHAISQSYCYIITVLAVFFLIQRKSVGLMRRHRFSQNLPRRTWSDRNPFSV